MIFVVENAETQVVYKVHFDENRLGAVFDSARVEGGERRGVCVCEDWLIVSDPRLVRKKEGG